jgi:hypothetical protein
MNSKMFFILRSDCFVPRSDVHLSDYYPAICFSAAIGVAFRLCAWLHQQHNILVVGTVNAHGYLNAKTVKVLVKSLIAQAAIFTNED